MTDLKPVKVHFEVLEKYVVFRVLRFEIKDAASGELIGYYRIWDDPDTNNIAYYGQNGDKHGVLSPNTYKAIPSNHKLIRYIEDDLNQMGYTIPDAHSRVTDAMLVGDRRFPTDWDAIC